jgi:hypothetical protein
MLPRMWPAVLVVSLLTPMATTSSMNARFLTGAVAEGAATHMQADVLTSTDLQTALDLEAQKQLASCGEASSCMAEIAAALDAELVITGTLLAVGHELTLQLAAYDVKKASSAGRKTLASSSVPAFAAPAQATAAAFVANALLGRDANMRLRVLVLDVDTAAADRVLAGEASSPTTASTPSRFGWLSVGGGAGIVVGAAGLVWGGLALADADAANRELTSTPPPPVAKQQELDATIQRSLPIAAIGLLGGGLVALASAGLVVWDGVTE